VPDIKVERVIVPPMSTVGLGFGTTDDGTVGVIFAGDHRLMRELGDAIVAGETPIVADVPEWAILGRTEL
jgi:hypothetical protein